MKTFQLFGPKDIRLVEKAVPVPDAHEVLVRPVFTGICGSDIHYFRHGYCGQYKPLYPFALGHEFAGVVERVGQQVQGLAVGDRVAVDPSMPCGTCHHCRSGQYNLCLSMRYFGSASCHPHIDGSMSQFVVVPAVNCYVLPPQMPMEHAALLEPLCVALHAVRQAGHVSGKSVFIAGGGPIGQLILRVLKAFGTYSITVSDVDAFARGFALKSGASAVVDPLVESEWKGMADFDVAFEASGNPAALSNALHVVKRGGDVVLVGTLPETFSISGNVIMNRQLRLLGSFRFAHVFEEALKLVASGIIELDGIVTATFSFDDIPLAFQQALEKNGHMKIQIAS